MSESRGELKVRCPATAEKTEFDCENENCSLRVLGWKPGLPGPRGRPGKVVLDSATWGLANGAHRA